VAQRWSHVLAVAAAEFLEHGYANANVARIARTAGVSKKTIYARCASKEELLIAVTEDLGARAHDATTTAMAAAGSDPERVLTSFGLQAAQDWIEPRDVGFYRLVVAETPRFPQLATAYRRVMGRFGATLADYLREQTARGALAVPDPDAAARQFGMLAYGEVRERALLGEDVSKQTVDAVVARAVRVFLRGYSSSEF
jgi:AcrR family transcriptional regulator